MALDLLLLPGLIPAFQTFLKLFLSFSGAPGLCILRCAVCVDFVLRVIFFFYFCFHLLLVGQERKEGEEEVTQQVDRSG